jgi:hypothetical protein
LRTCSTSDDGGTDHAWSNGFICDGEALLYGSGSGVTDIAISGGTIDGAQGNGVLTGYTFGCKIIDVTVKNSAGYGMSFTGTTRLIATACAADGDVEGTTLSDCPNAVINGCDITGTNTGIGIRGVCSGSMIVGCTIHDVIFGIDDLSTGGVHLGRNSFESIGSNWVSSASGVIYLAADSATRTGSPEGVEQAILGSLRRNVSTGQTYRAISNPSGFGYENVTPGFLPFKAINSFPYAMNTYADVCIVHDVTTGATVGASFVLGTPASNTGRTCTVAKVDAGAGTIAVTVDGGSTISGLATVTIATQWQSIDFFCNGVSWRIK